MQAFSSDGSSILVSKTSFLLAEYLLPASVFIISLLVRLTVSYQLSKTSPTFANPVIDSMVYDAMARNLALEGSWIQKGAFYQPPLYPLFLSAVYKVFGTSYLWPRIIQSILGAISCLLLYFVGKRFAGRSVGWLGGIFCAFYGPLIYFEVDLLPTGLTMFFILAGLLLLMRGLEKPACILFFLSGLSTGLAVISWPLVGLFGGAGIFVILRQFKHNYLRSFFYSLAIVVGITTAVSPITIFNYSKGEPVLISSNGPITFYAANNYNWKRTALFRPGYEWEKLVTLPYRIHGQEQVEKIGKTKVYFTESLNYFKEHPLRAIEAVVNKLYHLVYGHEIMNPTDMYFFKKYSSVLDRLIMKNDLVKFPFGVVFPLAAIGMLLSLYRRNSLNFLLMQYLVWGGLGMIIFCISARFRLIITPFLFLYAAFGVREMITFGFAESRIQRVFLHSLVLGGCLYILSNFNIFKQEHFFESPIVKSQSYFAMGRIMINQSQHREAMQWFEMALAADPDYPDAWIDLGRAKYSLGDASGAIDAMKRAHDIAPDYPLPLYNLAQIYDEQKPAQDAVAAVHYYKEFLETAEVYYEAKLRGEQRIYYAKRRVAELGELTR